MRARFEATRKEKDMRILAAWLEEGEKELWEKKSLDPFIFRDDEHGIIYNREPHMRDTMLDHWHPWEKVRCFPFTTIDLVLGPSLLFGEPSFFRKGEPSFLLSKPSQTELLVFQN